MNRRQFIRQLPALLAALAASGAAGCGRLLRPSRRPGLADGRIEPLTRSPDATGTPRTSAYPDISVARGPNPPRDVRLAIENLGGIQRFVKRGHTVIIKPNLTTGMPARYAVSTNPLVVAALVRLCLEAGASDVTVLERAGDSQIDAYAKSGIGAAVRAAGGRVKILHAGDFQDTHIPKGRLLTRWPLVKDIFDVDVFINVPIAKHHNLALLTMAMKNLMGVMGGDRSVMHEDFPQRIVDLNTIVRPDLVVLDAYRILVRNGPLGGNLQDVRETRTVIAGTNQVSIDAYGATLFGMDPTDLPFLVEAARRGLGEIDLGKLEVAEDRA